MTKLLATTTLLLTLLVLPLMAKVGDVYMCEMKTYTIVWNSGRIMNNKLETFSFKIGRQHVLFSKGEGFYSGWKLDFEKEYTGRFFTQEEANIYVFYAQNGMANIWLRRNLPSNNFILKHASSHAEGVTVVISECDKAF